jgi:hypothetical protein
VETVTQGRSLLVVELLGDRGELADDGDEDPSSDGSGERSILDKEEADCEEREHSEHGNGGSDSNELDASLRGVRHDVLLKSVGGLGCSLAVDSSIEESVALCNTQPSVLQKI